MKNEDRILELLAETLQRMDQQNERMDQQNERFEQQNERFERWQMEMKLLREEMNIQQENTKLQLEIALASMKKIQQHDDRLDRQEEGILAIRERTELMRLTALEQQQAYRDISELLMFHNKALREKNLL